MSAKKLRAVLYARYSTDRQREESAEDQFRMCRRVAEREDMTVVATYSDPGISGGTAQRPQYQAMRCAARGGEFDIVIAEDLKRLWREQAEQWDALKEWLDLGIHVVTASGIDSRQKGFKLIASVQGAAAELERNEAAYRTRRGLEGKAIAGKTTGGKAYGYDTGPKGRTINRAQAKVVLRIFEMRANGMSARAIAHKLNGDGIPSPGASWNRKEDGPNQKAADKGWRSNAIAGDPRKGTGILNNRLYVGEVIWGRTRWERKEVDSKVRKPVAVPAEQWIRHSCPELRIVPDALWRAVEKMQNNTGPRGAAIREAKRRAVAAGGKRAGGWLNSILVCEECGANYVSYGPREYICATHIHGGDCDNGMRFRRDEAQERMFELLREELCTPERIERERQRCLAILKQQEQAERVTVARAELTAEIDKQIAALKSMKGKLSPAMLNAALVEAERERAAIVASCSGKTQERAAAARKAIGSLEQFSARYKKLIESAILKATDPEKLAKAREATRRLLKNGQVRLAPTAARTAVHGPVALLGLGSQWLEAAGAMRQPRDLLRIGSGGRI